MPSAKIARVFSVMNVGKLNYVEFIAFQRQRYRNGFIAATKQRNCRAINNVTTHHTKVARLRTARLHRMDFYSCVVLRKNTDTYNAIGIGIGVQPLTMKTLNVQRRCTYRLFDWDVIA